MPDEHETVIPGETTDDWNVVLRADLIGDPMAGVVRVVPHGDGDADRHPVVSDVRFTDGLLRNVNLTRARFTEPVLEDIDLWAWGPNLTPPIDGLRINGIDVAPLVAAELDRRHPERRHLQDLETLDDVRTAWPHVEAMWAPTMDRARDLPADLLQERVNGEFSFLETLRHLLFATDAWVRRVALGQDQPFHAIALAYPDDQGCWSPDGTVPWSTVGIDIHADPSLDEVLAAREDNFAMIRAALAGLDDEAAQVTTAPRQTPGYPPGPEVRQVLRCFKSIVNEEWWHHQYATRDLAVLLGDG